MEIQNKTYLSVDDVVRKFNVSKSYIYKKTSTRELPFYKIGRSIVFDEVELTRLLLTTGRREVLGS